MTFPEPNTPEWDFAWGRLQDVLLEHRPGHTLDDYMLMFERNGALNFKHRDTREHLWIDAQGKLMTKP